MKRSRRLLYYGFGLVFKLLTIGILLQHPFSKAEMLSVYERVSTVINENQGGAHTAATGEEDGVPVDPLILRNEKTQLEAQIHSLEEQIESFRSRLNEVNRLIVAQQSIQKIPFTAQDREEVMTHQLGKCRIQPGETPGSYVIDLVSNSLEESIQFSFADLDSPEQAYVTLENTVSGAVIMEITQPRFVSQLFKERSEMEARIKVIVHNQQAEIVSATFLGQKINDRMFGRHSYQPYRVFCKTSL